jgi:hypothetical protein
MKKEDFMINALYKGLSENFGWIKGYLWCVNGQSYITPIHSEADYNKENLHISTIDYEVISKTIGQFSGETDRNQTEIFAGDIIRCVGGCIGIVNFGEYKQTFVETDEFSRHIGFYIDFEDKYLRKDLGFWVDHGATVIGNIWDDEYKSLRGKFGYTD